jgi:cysteine synthase
MIHPSIAATVGQTPLVQLRRIPAGLKATLLAKLESRNPCGSVKDRVGVAMIEDAERRGLLKPGATLVEATSGNTGIALAFASAAKGYRLVLTMPERMSKERVLLLQYLGAQVVLTPGTLMRDAVEKAKEIARQTPGAVELHQFDNPANPEAHRKTTAQEIWNDTQGKVDVFVSGVGTGGTITGVGEVLKAKNPQVRIVAVEPSRAAVLSGRTPANHMIQGIGAGFIPTIFNRDVVDEILTVDEDDAFACARRLAREEGIPAGISSGATLAASLVLAQRPELAGKTIVFMVCDSGERYTTTPLIDELVASKGPRG